MHHSRVLPGVLTLLALALASCKSPPPAATPATSTPGATSTPTEPMTTTTAGGAATTTTSGPHTQSARDPYPGAPATRVQVSAKGFDPDIIPATEDTPMAIVFTRTTDKTCGTEVVFPFLEGLTVPLPLNEPTRVSFKPGSAHELQFSCGMRMLKGKIVVTKR